jgi:hypothetical protein
VRFQLSLDLHHLQNRPSRARAPRYGGLAVLFDPIFSSLDRASRGRLARQGVEEEFRLPVQVPGGYR